MSYKISVSKSGYDVETETNPNNLNYSSDYNTLKYYGAGTISIAGSAAFGESNKYYGTVTHNLGDYFYCSVYMNPTWDTSRYFKNSCLDPGGGAVTQYASSFITPNNIRCYLLLENFSGGTIFGTVTFYVKLYRNNLGL
jgi:hypothetical protein